MPPPRSRWPGVGRRSRAHPARGAGRPRVGETLPPTVVGPLRGSACGTPSAPTATSRHPARWSAGAASGPTRRLRVQPVRQRVAPGPHALRRDAAPRGGRRGRVDAPGGARRPAEFDGTTWWAAWATASARSLRRGRHRRRRASGGAGAPTGRTWTASSGSSGSAGRLLGAADHPRGGPGRVVDGAAAAGPGCHGLLHRRRSPAGGGRGARAACSEGLSGTRLVAGLMATTGCTGSMPPSRAPASSRGAPAARLAVGDAARTLDPLSGQGLEVALTSAIRAAAALLGPCRSRGRWSSLARPRRSSTVTWPAERPTTAASRAGRRAVLATTTTTAGAAAAAAQVSARTLRPLRDGRGGRRSADHAAVTRGPTWRRNARQGAAVSCACSAGSTSSRVSGAWRPRGQQAAAGLRRAAAQAGRPAPGGGGALAGGWRRARGRQPALGAGRLRGAGLTSSTATTASSAPRRHGGRRGGERVGRAADHRLPRAAGPHRADGLAGRPRPAARPVRRLGPIERERMRQRMLHALEALTVTSPCAPGTPRRSTSRRWLLRRNRCGERPARAGRGPRGPEQPRGGRRCTRSTAEWSAGSSAWTRHRS